MQKQSADIKITINLDRELKDKAKIIFNSIGLTMTDAISIFLRKAVEQNGILFSVCDFKDEFDEYRTNEVTRTIKYAVEKDTAEKKEKRLSYCTL